MLFTSFQADHSRTKTFAKADPEGDCRPPIAFEFRSWSKCLQTLPGSCAKVLDNCPVIYIIRKKAMEAGLLDYLYQARQSVPNGLCTRERRANGHPCAEVIASALTLSFRAAFLCSLFILVFSIPDILALRFVRILRRGKS